MLTLLARETPATDPDDCQQCAPLAHPIVRPRPSSKDTERFALPTNTIHKTRPPGCQPLQVQDNLPIFPFKPFFPSTNYTVSNKDRRRGTEDGEERQRT